MRYNSKKYSCLAVIVALVAVFSATKAHAAREHLYGHVVDADSVPVPETLVSLLELPDTTYVATVITDSQGRFDFDDLSASRDFLISVKSFGFKQCLKPVDGSGYVLVRLEPEADSLDEVTVHGKAPVVKRDAGKFIFIPNDLAKDVDDAYGLMKFVPLVNVNSSKFRIIGKLGDSKIYLNGRDPHMSNSAIIGFLKTLPPGYIKRVEVQTATDASQQASYNGGIINIVYDDPAEGVVGTVSASVNSESDRLSTNENVWLAYTKNKFKASASIYNDISSSKEGYRTLHEFVDLGKTVMEHNEKMRHSYTLAGSVNLSYDLSSRSTIGAAFNMGGGRSHVRSRVSSLTDTDEGEYESLYTATARSPMYPNWGVVAYYNLATDSKGSNLDLSADYSKGRSSSEKVDNVDGIQTFESSHGLVEGYMVKANYNHVFSGTTRLTAGADCYRSTLDDSQDLGGVDSQFNYKEFIGSGFIQFSRMWTPWLGTSASLRLEHTRVEGMEAHENEKVSQNYTDLFPSLSLNFNLPRSNQSIVLEYSYNISRPRYHQLIPFKRWSSDMAYYTGNPDLKPSYSHVINLYYSFLSSFTLSVMYVREDKGIDGYTLNTPDGMLVSSFDNVGDSWCLYTDISFKKKLLPFWHIYAGAGVSLKRTHGWIDDRDVGYSGRSGSLSLGNSFIISRRHGLKASLNYEITSPIENLLTSDSRWRNMMIIRASKTFGFGGTVSLSLFNILAYRPDRHYSLPDYRYDKKYLGQRVNAYISFSYTFGRQSVNSIQDRSRTTLNSRK